MTALREERATGAAAHRATRGSALAAPALLIVIALPFLASAYKIDDPLYLLAARRVLESPFDPLGGPSFWHERPTTLFHDLYNPPLIAYVLALPVAIDGGREASVHVLMLAMAALALLVCSRLGDSWGVPRRFALLLAASPALATSSVAAMTDVPFLLLCALTWHLALSGRGARSGLLAGLSALTKYVGLLNVPLMLLALLRRGRRPVVAAAAAAASVFGAFCCWNLAADGALHIGAAGRFQAFGVAQQGNIAASFVASVGVAGLPAALGLLRWSRGLALCALASGLAGLAMSVGSQAQPALTFASFAAGGALLFAAARATRRARDAFLPAAFWGYALYSCVFVYFGTARYLLPALPPLLWLLATGGEIEINASRTRFAASVAVAAALSIAVLHADAEYAGAWREAARRLPRADRGFYTGRWGFAWYAEKQGYRPLTGRERLRPGDVVAEPAGIHVVPPSPAQAALLEPTLTIEVPSPVLRVMDPETASGFYSSAWGILPFGFRRGAREHVVVSSPAPSLLAALDAPVTAPVVVDLGSDAARGVCLDGWSDPEPLGASPSDGAFVWAVGPDSALRLPLPRGIVRMTLEANATAEASGPLRIDIGGTAHAVFHLSPGWRVYQGAVEGYVPGGVTDVILRPAGRFRPGPLSVDRRERSVAIDFLAFGDSAETGDRGRWPVQDGAGRPRLFVAGQAPRPRSDLH